MKASAALWQNCVVGGKEVETSELVRAMRAELPQLVSAVIERTCNLNCAHCLYPPDTSSAAVSRANALDACIENIVRQMPAPSETYHPKFLSVGRILRSAHLALFARLRELRPEVELGVIDNGSFTKLLNKWPSDFRFDWMDVSLDGLEKAHNAQRRSPLAFAMAINGIKQARTVSSRVTSLFTLTRLNYRDVEGVADLLLGGEEPMVDQFRVTFVSPTNDTNAALVVTPEQLALAWESMQRITEKYGQDRIGEFGIYRMEDVELLAAAVGERKLLKAFTVQDEGEATLFADANVLVTEMDGVVVSYQPLSIWPPEEFLIEADAAQRVAHEGKFTLAELRNGSTASGVDTSAYTVSQLTPESDFRAEYEQCVDHYWQRIGLEKLREEQTIWGRIRSRVGV